MKRVFCFALFLFFLGLSGCSLPVDQAHIATPVAYTQPGISTPASTSPPVPTLTSSPMASPTVAPSSTFTPSPYPSPNLAARPLVWFAPLPPLKILPSRSFTGSDDFMQLFSSAAAWQVTAGYVQVFKLYGEWVEDVPWSVHATDAELAQVIADLRQRGIALAVEMGPLEPGENCGQEIEGFAGIQAGLHITQRIKDAGGQLSYVSFDEPYAFASIYDGPKACHWSPEKVAQEVKEYMSIIRTVFPDVVFGDTEPLWTGVEVDRLKPWFDAYETVTGSPLAFFHLDQDFSRPNWEQDTLKLESYAREHGVDFGVIYLGDASAQTDEAWLSAAGEHVLDYEDLAGGRPDHVIFQSWYDHPDRVLPESQPYTFTWLIRSYFEDRVSLGSRREGRGANLALDKPALASSSYAGYEPGAAVDGSSSTWWGAGAFAPQWIEIDLGKPYSIAEIKLLTSQSPDGQTTHNVVVRGPGTGDDYLLVHTFTGVTHDQQWLSVQFSEPMENIRYIRLQTVESPSWVSWREIEVIAAK